MAELFKWPPQFHEEWNNSDGWNTVISKYENHASQRRAKWSRRYGKWRMTFSKEVAVAVNGITEIRYSNAADEILDFFNARQGRAQSFYLPSWKGEFKLSTAHTAPFSSGSITLVSSATIASKLTTVVGQRGNLIHVSSDDAEGSNGDVFQITNIASNVLTVTRVAGTNTSYAANTLVNICYEVYFDSDELSQDNILPILYKSGINFIEK